MRIWRLTILGVFLTGLGGCPQASQRNPYLTFVESFGIESSLTPGTGGGGQGVGADVIFRRPMTLQFQNRHSYAVLETSFIAWVELGSVRSADQQDALLASNYVQLSRALDLGSAYRLPVGTFVYNGPGTAGATPVRLGPAGGAVADDDDTQTGDEGVTPTTATFELLTPDAILVFSQPPVSCDSEAFRYSEDGVVLPGPTSTVGGHKTLAQIDVYQCDPFTPGVFLQTASGDIDENEYLEGNTVTFTFFQGLLQDGSFASVSVTAASEGGDGNQFIEP